MLSKEKSVSIHSNKIQVLATEIYQTINGLTAIIKNRIFEIEVLNMRKCWKVTFGCLRNKNVWKISFKSLRKR